MKCKKMYYDSFADEYVKEIDLYAPPERYLLTYRGDKSYIETYEDKQGKRLEIAYSDVDIRHNMVNQIRFAVAEEHGFELAAARMIKWIIPSELFDKYEKRFAIDWSEEE